MLLALLGASSGIVFDVTLSADLSSRGDMSADMNTRLRRRNPPRREYIYVYGLDGEQKAVIG